MKTHPVSVGHLVAGLLFLGIAASWALRESGVIDDASWMAPATLLLAGAVGLVAALAKGVGGGRRTDEEAEREEDLEL